MNIRIGILGDIHAEDAYLKSALAHLDAAGVDLRVAVGDIVDGRGSVDECYALLVAANVLVVCGNHERWFLDNTMRELPEATPQSAVSPDTMRYLSNLPVELDSESSVGKARLCHGLGANDMAKVNPDDYGYALKVNDDLNALLDRGYRFVINGHTHRPMARQIGGTTIINGGTLKYDNDPGFLILDTAAGEVEFFRFSRDGSIDLNKRVELNDPS